MKRFSLWVSALVLVGLALWFWWGQPVRLANLPPTARGPWVAFGDSLTAGTGMPPESGYPAQLGRQLGVAIVNLGVSGDTTADGRARLPEALQLNPRVVLLCLGGNDSLQREPLDRTFANLAALVDAFQQTGAFVVLLGVRSASVLDQHRRRFARLAREKRVLLVPDLLDGVLGTPALMADPLHPNEAGYARIAERIATALEPHLDQLR
jgi:lysophospholipase L1-like esterase